MSARRTEEVAVESAPDVGLLDTPAREADPTAQGRYPPLLQRLGGLQLLADAVHAHHKRQLVLLYPAHSAWVL